MEEETVAVEHTGDQRMEGGAVEGSGLGEQRVDPLGGEPLELVAPGRRGPQHLDQFGAGGGHLVGAQHSLDHRRAGRLHRRDQLGHRHPIDGEVLDGWWAGHRR